MGTILLAILKAARPRQWLKNCAVFTTMLFSGHAFDQQVFTLSLQSFFVFCLLASSGYILNDVLDAPKDRKHPFKKYRPVASGVLTIPIALSVSFLFLITGLYLAFGINTIFFFTAASFVLLQYLYSLIFKHVSVIDILAITTAYFIRVYAGEAATGYHISIWLSLTALSLALFLATGKRRSEITLLSHYRGVVPSDTRNSLTHYSEKLLDAYSAMFANSTFISYAFYTFLEKPKSTGFFFIGYDQFVSEFPNRKWLMITIPFVLYGIMRYMQLIYEGKGESPEKILTSDKPLLSTVILWGMTVFLIMYGIGG